MTLALLVLGFGMLLILAGVKGYSVRSLAQGQYGKATSNTSVATA
jgi:hypothetical protein